MSDSALFLLAIFSIFLAVASAMWVLLSNAEERATVKASLKSLDDYERADLRSQELEAPILQRVIAPVGRSLVALGRRFMPGGYMEGVRRRLIIAGKPSQQQFSTPAGSTVPATRLSFPHGTDPTERTRPAGPPGGDTSRRRSGSRSAPRAARRSAKPP